MNKACLKAQIEKYITDILEPRREEFSNLPACPYVKKERTTGKLLIDVFDCENENLLDKIREFCNSEYTSAVFGQVMQEPLCSKDGKQYQDYLNKQLKLNGMKHLKIICANPQDDYAVKGFNVRAPAPCFLITVTDKKELSKAHKSILKTDYFINFDKEYLKYLQIKETQLNENWHKKN